MEAAALYAFASACGRPVVCLAHVSNQLGCVEGDFEKGDGNGVCGSVELVTRLASAWLQAACAGRPGRKQPPRNDAMTQGGPAAKAPVPAAQSSGMAAGHGIER